MDGRQQAAPDAEALVQDLGDRGGAIRRAAGVADDAGVGVHDLVIHPHDDRRIEGILARNRQDHALRAGLEMLLELLEMSEGARALDHVVDAELLPRQLRRIALGEDQEGIAVDVHRVVVDLGRPGIAPVDAVVAERVEQGFGRGDVVDRDDVEMAVELGDAGDGAADSSEAIDCDLRNAHAKYLFRVGSGFGSGRVYRAPARRSRVMGNAGPRASATSRSGRCTCRVIRRAAWPSSRPRPMEQRCWWATRRIRAAAARAGRAACRVRRIADRARSQAGIHQIWALYTGRESRDHAGTRERGSRDAP